MKQYRKCWGQPTETEELCGEVATSRPVVLARGSRVGGIIGGDGGGGLVVVSGLGKTVLDGGVGLGIVGVYGQNLLVNRHGFVAPTLAVVSCSH